MTKQIVFLVIFFLCPFTAKHVYGEKTIHFDSFNSAPNLVRYLSSDPTGLAPDYPLIEFILEKGSCVTLPPYNDCDNHIERSELIQSVFTKGIDGRVWYRWNLWFPKDYKNYYPSKVRHSQFYEKNSINPIIYLEVGSTNVLWLVVDVGDQKNYYSLIERKELIEKWHDIALYIKWDKKQGQIVALVNGVERAIHTGKICDLCEARMSFGVYRSGISDFILKNPDHAIDNSEILFTEPVIVTSDPYWFSSFKLINDNEALKKENTVDDKSIIDNDSATILNEHENDKEKSENTDLRVNEDAIVNKKSPLHANQNPTSENKTKSDLTGANDDEELEKSYSHDPVLLPKVDISSNIKREEDRR